MGMIRDFLSSELEPSMDGKKVKIAGWVDEIRDLGGIKFIVVRDREGKVQVTFPKKKVSKEVLEASSVSKESVVRVTGTLKKMDNAPNGFEIVPSDFEIISLAHVPLPLDISDKIESDLDTRLDARFMDLRRAKNIQVFKIRSKILTFIRDYYISNGFIEINTSKIVSAGAEGGSSLFPITYYDKEAFLAQSPQLYKQSLMSACFDRIFEIGPSYRAEESDTTRHLSEFWQLDSEMSFISDEEDVLKVLEGLMHSVLDRTRIECAEELKALDVKVDVPKLPLPRITYSECISVLEKEYDKKIPWGADIDTASERLIGAWVQKKHKTDVYFITEYPSKIKPFYVMVRDDDPKLSRAFDLEYKGEEIASGGQREHRFDVLTTRMKEKGISLSNFNFYLDAFKFGMPPHGGYGLGIDRLVKLALNLGNVRETVLFPRDMKRVVP
jgi:aspartyl-tRNA synthetase